MATKEEAAQAAEGRVNVPIGYRYGYPAFHLFSGNLPVVTPALHKPRKVPVDGVSAAELNLVSSDASGLSKSWVVLIDPKTQRPFWWNRRFRSRRDVRPAADDEGREGAGQGEPGTTCFIECFDLPSNRLFYVDLIHATTTWARPDDYARSCDKYEPLWHVLHPGGDAPPRYLNSETGAIVDARPADFDGEPLTSPPKEGSEPPGIPDELKGLVQSKHARRFVRRQGWGYKAGPGGRMFSSTAFKRRYFVLDDGQLTYHDSEEAAKKGVALKDCHIDLVNYEVDFTEGEIIVELYPRVDRTTLAHAVNPKTAPAPKRKFKLSFETPEETAAWAEAFRGIDEPAHPSTEGATRSLAAASSVSTDVSDDEGAAAASPPASPGAELSAAGVGSAPEPAKPSSAEAEAKAAEIVDSAGASDSAEAAASEATPDAEAAPEAEAAEAAPEAAVATPEAEAEAAVAAPEAEAEAEAAVAAPEAEAAAVAAPEAAPEAEAAAAPEAAAAALEAEAEAEAAPEAPTAASSQPPPPPVAPAMPPPPPPGSLPPPPPPPPAATAVAEVEADIPEPDDD